MKRLLFIIVLITGFVTTYSYADNEGYMMDSGMMGGSGHGEAMESDSSSDHPMMGNMECMMGQGMMMSPGMMKCGMAPGMMGCGGCNMMNRGGQGMMGHMRGMMGPGMMGMKGCGMMSSEMMGPDDKERQKFLDETKDIRKKMHSKKFEYFEAIRKPDTSPDAILGLEKELYDLQWELYEKMPR